MGVNKFNCEGYYDPTAYEALTKIEQEAKALRGLAVLWCISALRWPGIC
mgnify:CR=1 FL=1